DRARRATADDLAARFPHGVGLALREELLPDLLLRELDPHAGVGTAVLVQHAAVEPGLVDFGLRLLEFLPIRLVADPESLDDLDPGKRPPSGRADDRDRLDPADPIRV